MTAVTMRLDGLSSALAKLESLDRRIRSRAVRKAVRAGGAPIVKSARQQAPVGNGTLKRSITQKIKQYGGSGVVLSVIGQRVDNRGKGVGSTGKKGGISGRGDLVPVHLVESRTKPHAIRGRQNITLAYPVLAFAGNSGAVVIRRRVRASGNARGEVHGPGSPLANVDGRPAISGKTGNGSHGGGRQAMSDVGKNLRTYLLDDPAISFQLAAERIHQNKVPQEEIFPFISYFRRGTQDEHTTDESNSAQPFRHLFDLECVSDDIDQALDLAELVKARLGDRAAYSDVVWPRRRASRVRPGPRR